MFVARGKRKVRKNVPVYGGHMSSPSCLPINKEGDRVELITRLSLKYCEHLMYLLRIHSRDRDMVMERPCLSSLTDMVQFSRAEPERSESLWIGTQYMTLENGEFSLGSLRLDKEDSKVLLEKFEKVVSIIYKSSRG